MGFWIPAILLGSVGASHHYASKELDFITKEADQPTFGFWWGVSLGVLGGIWIGFNCHQSIRRSIKCLEWLAGIDETSSTKRDPVSHPAQFYSSDIANNSAAGYNPLPTKNN